MCTNARGHRGVGKTIQTASREKQRCRGLPRQHRGFGLGLRLGVELGLGSGSGSGLAMSARASVSLVPFSLAQGCMDFPPPLSSPNTCNHTQGTPSASSWRAGSGMRVRWPRQGWQHTPAMCETVGMGVGVGVGVRVRVRVRDWIRVCTTCVRGSWS